MVVKDYKWQKMDVVAKLTRVGGGEGAWWEATQQYAVTASGTTFPNLLTLNQFASVLKEYKYQQLEVVGVWSNSTHCNKQKESCP